MRVLTSGYTTYVEAGEEWCAAAGTVRHYALQWTGYMRRGKAGVEKRRKGLGRVIVS
jgi:hypothetical protein